MIGNVNDHEATWTFYDKELQKTKQTVLEMKKMMNQKAHKLYVHWKFYNNLFNS